MSPQIGSITASGLNETIGKWSCSVTTRQPEGGPDDAREQFGLSLRSQAKDRSAHFILYFVFFLRKNEHLTKKRRRPARGTKKNSADRKQDGCVHFVFLQKKKAHEKIRIKDLQKNEHSKSAALHRSLSYIICTFTEVWASRTPWSLDSFAFPVLARLAIVGPLNRQPDGLTQRHH